MLFVTAFCLVPTAAKEEEVEGQEEKEEVILEAEVLIILAVSWIPLRRRILPSLSPTI